MRINNGERRNSRRLGWPWRKKMGRLRRRQAAGVQTRARALAMAAMKANKVSPLQLRRLRRRAPAVNSPAGGGAGDHGRCISGGSSIASCDPVEGSRAEIVDDATSADCVCKRWEKNASKAAAELEEFFLAAEARERRRFADKYNYDVAEDVPIEGRYEWLPSSAP